MSEKTEEFLFIALDGEFTGPNPFKNYMIALGAFAYHVIVDHADPKKSKAEKCDMFGISMKPPTDQHGFDEDCMKYFWSKQEALLKKFTEEGVTPEEGMKEFVKWVEGLAKWKRVVFLVDCTTDSFWVDHYLMKYADHAPLNVFFGDFTGQPFVTDDQYRGILGTTAAWGIDERIDNLFDIGAIPKGTHDPTEDAKEICARYAAFFIEQNARKANLKN